MSTREELREEAEERQRDIENGWKPLTMKKLTYTIICDHCGTKVRCKMTSDEFGEYLGHRHKGYGHADAYRWAVEGWDVPKKVKSNKK